MADKKQNSLFGSFFSRKTKSLSSDDEILQCLLALSAIGEGIDRKVDREINTFKKMIKVGTTTPELQNQVAVISQTLKLSAALPENNKLIKLFKQIPAKILIDEFLSHSLSVAVKLKLQNYLTSLTPKMLASNSIPDLISILETETRVNKTTPDVSTPEPNLTDITNPLLQLFTQIELSKEQKSELQKMQIRSEQMHDFNDLSAFIEDVSHIILGLIANSSDKFESFLIQLKRRLDTVNKALASNRETSQALSRCSDSFSNQVSEQVHHLQSSLGNTTDIAQLEATISKTLENITTGISSFDNDRKDLERQASRKIAELEQELTQTLKETDHLKNNLQQLKDRALFDPLTQLPNRQAYNERLHLEYNRWLRYKQPLSLIMGDIDLFKNINDTYGHIAGDTALKETAEILQKGVRGTDFVARFGGEEFVILMPETTIKDATIAINKIRKSIQNHIISESSIEFKLTMSFGVASFADNDNFKAVLLRADKAMYRAKNKGRNQVCIERKNDS